MRKVQSSIDLHLPPEEVLEIFIKQEHLHAWWGVHHSLIDISKEGVYSLVWQTKQSCFDYVMTGVIAEYLPACQLHIKNLICINPERPIVGPMELFIFTTPESRHTSLTVVQTCPSGGVDEAEYLASMSEGWPQALRQAKNYLESITIE